MGNLLTGVHVLENASVITGPFAGQVLADLGADVIKVEQPGEGDSFRRWDGTSDHMRMQFASLNRGKRSVALDLRNVADTHAFLDLARRADVVIENFRPGTADRLGVGYEMLREVNPRLVYCDITGMGSSGPYAKWPTYDGVAQAISGLWSVYVDLTDPTPVGPAMADQLTGLYATCAILAGLASRESTGRGTRVSVNMLSSSLSFIRGSLARFMNTGLTDGKTSRAEQSQTYAFSTSDGLPLAIHLSTPRKFWESLCNAVELPDLASDPRFATKPLRVAAYRELHVILAERFATKPRDEWLSRLRACDVPCAPIQSIPEVARDPQVADLGMFWHDPRWEFELLRCPIAVEDEFVAHEASAPVLGEHTEEVLRSIGATRQ